MERDLPQGRSEVLPLELDIGWRDAHFDFDWDGTQRDDYIVHTIGFLVAEGPNFLSIAQERLPDGDGFRAVTHIPLSSVASREVNKPRPTTSVMTSIQGGQG